MLTATNQANAKQGTINFTITATDEFRIISEINTTHLKNIFTIIENIIKQFQVFDTNIKKAIVNQVDEGWAQFSVSLAQHKIVKDNILIFIYRYGMTVAFKFFVIDPQLQEFVSPNSINDGFSNMFSIHIDCIGHEMMEIRTNNYIAKNASLNNIPSKSKIINPCYPEGYTHYFQVTSIGTYEVCDHFFYTNFNHLEYIIMGGFNENLCHSLLDKIFSEKNSCPQRIKCSLFDLPPNIISYNPNPAKILISLQAADFGEKISSFDSLIQSLYKSCAALSSESIMTQQQMEKQAEKCFYGVYLKYLYQKLGLEQRKTNTEPFYVDFYQYFVFGPKVYGPDSPHDATGSPNGTTGSPNGTTGSPNGATGSPDSPGNATGSDMSQTSSKLPMIIGIVVGILLLLVLIAVLVYLAHAGYFNKGSKKYDVAKATGS